MFINCLAFAADPGGALRCRPATHRHSLASRLQRLAFCAALLATSSHAVHAGNVTLAWNPNPEPDISGYELSYGTATGSYTRTVDAAANLEATATGLDAGTIYYFAVTAINTQGLRSPFSDEVIYYSGYGDAVPTTAWTVQTPAATNAFDGNAATLFLTGPSAVGYHDLEINMGIAHAVEGLRYLPRQDGSSVGNITQYEIYLSQDGVKWGSPVSTGTFSSSAEIKEVRFAAQTAAFVRLRSLAQATSDNECAVAEIEMIESASPGTSNRTPSAIATSYAVEMNRPLPIVLTGIDADSDPLNFSIATSPLHGTLSGTPPNLTYQPTGHFTGTDSFTFLANDGTVNSAPATITITVSHVNEAPVAIAQTLATVDGTPLSIALTATDGDGDSLTFNVVHPPNHGTLSGIPPYFTYLPAAGYFGTDSLAFQANDGTVNSAVATITIAVTKPATWPGTKVVSRAGWSLLYTDSQEPFDGLATYAFDGDPATSWHTEWRNGTLPPTPHEIQIDLGTPTSITGFQYLPRQDQVNIGNIGSYEFYVSANGIDWGILVASGTFENSASEKQVIFTAKTGRFIRLRALTEASENAITCVAELNVLTGNLINQIPVAVNQSLSAKVSETPVAIVLAGSDPEGSPLSFAISNPPLHGTLSGAPPYLSYLPNPGFAGVDQFTYQVNDGAEFSAPATVSITVIPNPVIPLNHAPSFPGSNITLAASQGTAFDAFLIASDPDAGDPLTFKKLSGPSWLQISPEGILSGTPTYADTGINTFSVKVSDPSDASDTTTLTIMVANSNDAPSFQISDMTYPNGTEKISYTGQSLAFTASDADGADTISYSKVSGPDWLSIATSGELSGTPPAASAGLHTFAIRATDPSGDFADATIQIHVYPNNLPLPWNLAQLGTDDVAGSAKYTSGIYAVTGGGALSSTLDGGNFAWQTITMDGDIIARISQLSDTGEDTRVGLMLRESLSSSARQVFMGVDAAGKYQFARRATIGGAIGVATRNADENRPIWLRLNRKDGMITGYKSNDGTIWTKVGSTNLKLKDACYLGLSVSSGNPTVLNTSKFSNVRITR